MSDLQNVTLDFECFFDTKQSLSKMTTAQYVHHKNYKTWGVGIKFDDNPAEWYSEDDVEWALNDIHWANTNLICHNTMFDGFVLKHKYGHVPARYSDTAAMARGLAPGLSSSLKDVCIRLFPDDPTMRKGEELLYVKGIFDLTPKQDEELGRYCQQDCELTWAIYQRMLQDFPVSELEIIHLTVDMFCNAKFVLDTNLLKSELKLLKERNKKTIEASGLPVKLLRSRNDFPIYLKETLGIEPPTKISKTTGKKTFAFAKDDAAFQQMCAMYPDYDHIWKAKVLSGSRLEETRPQRFLDSVNPDGTFGAPLRYYNAHTGRFAGGDKLNVQNMTRGSFLRRALRAPEGQLVYVIDLAAIEARMTAWLAGEDILLSYFRNGDDVYSIFASTVYGFPVTKADNPIERFVGKTCILGLGYGMGKDRFRDTLASGAAGPVVQVSTNRAQDIVYTYRNTYPMIPALWKKIESLLISSMHPANEGTRYGPLTLVKNGFRFPNGMVMGYHNLRQLNNELLFDLRNKTNKTFGGSLTENIAQGLSRILITDAMLRINRRLAPHNGKVVLTVHDEIVAIADDAAPDEIMTILEEEVCRPPPWAPDIPLAAEGGYAKEYSK